MSVQDTIHQPKRGLIKWFLIFAVVLCMAGIALWEWRAVHPVQAPRSSARNDYASDGLFNALAEIPLSIYEEVDAKGKQNIAEITTKTTDLGKTLLFFAAGRGRSDLVHYLIKKGADPRHVDRFGGTALHDAAAGGHNDVIRTLIAAGADVNASREYSGTPLALAVSCGKIGAVATLISNGADPHKTLPGRVDLLRTAIELKDPLMVGALLDLNGKPFTVSGHNKNGELPIHVAVQYSDVATVGVLLGHGSEINPPRETDGQTPLHIAASSGNMGMARFLITQGAVINPVDKKGCTPTTAALREGHAEIANMLADCGGQRRGPK